MRKGKRRNRLRTLQVFQCVECLHRFTDQAGKRVRRIALKAILDAVSTFNLGHTITDTQRLLRQRTHLEIPERTIRRWLEEYKPLTSYARLRTQGRKLFASNAIIQGLTLFHQQVYRFQVHLGKLAMLVDTTAHKHLAPLTDYLTAVRQGFPHALFQESRQRS